MEWVVSLAAATVSVSTAVFGYLQLARNSRVQLIEEQVSTYEKRIGILESERDDLLDRLKEIDRLLAACRRECRALKNEKIDLLIQLRAAEKGAGGE